MTVNICNSAPIDFQLNNRYVFFDFSLHCLKKIENGLDFEGEISIRPALFERHLRRRYTLA